MEPSGWLDPAAFWAMYDDGEQQVRRVAAGTSVFGLVGWPGDRATGEWDLGSTPPTVATLIHGSDTGTPHVTVRTTTQDPVVDVSLQRMRGGVHDSGPQMIARQHALQEEMGDDVVLPVDGNRTVFTVWQERDGWWAAGSHDGHGLVLGVRGMDPATIELVRILDFEPYFEGRRARLRAARGEG
ncbi:hypothetical protein [Arthrobacter sp. H41]|uniref:hypothetical protein n=1 Tax=Arthrobacter sp. H41 TaxID=1312978 RepID=UPI00047A7F03|nr:hypothetical protein [Arthrobacter sp. H41]